MRWLGSPLVYLALAFGPVGGLACIGPEGGETGMPGAASPDGGASAAAFKPALAPSAPQISSAGGRVLASPKLFAVTFAGDPLAHDLETFTQKIALSSYWSATTEEYGVGRPVVQVIHEGAPPTNLTDSFSSNDSSATLRSWISSKLSGRSPPWGAPDPDALYVLYLPAGSYVTMQCGKRTCEYWGGYHQFVTLPSGTKIAYALIPRCKGLDHATTVASHEMVEAVTDPFLNAFWHIDGEHAAWGRQGSEVADMCEHQDGITTKPDDLGYTVQRSWSNQAARSGHDPCVPQDKPYFNSVPSLPAQLDVADPNQDNHTVSAPGLMLHVGESTVIDLKLFSDQPTNNPWTVKAHDESARVRANDNAVNCSPNPTAPPDLSFSITNPPTGKNGDTLRLIIRADRADAMLKGPALFSVYSTLDGVDNVWWGWVLIQ